MKTLKTLTLATATGVATFLCLGLATPETTPHPAPAHVSQASRTTLPPAPVRTFEQKYEDDPTWNCFTDGNQSCGDVPRVTQSLGDSLSEGDNEAPAHAGTRNWESCVILPNPRTINCPDGYTQPI